MLSQSIDIINTFILQNPNQSIWEFKTESIYLH